MFRRCCPGGGRTGFHRQALALRIVPALTSRLSRIAGYHTKRHCFPPDAESINTMPSLSLCYKAAPQEISHGPQC
uniref:Uncharacterized protein n=1 Tax=Magnetospirillum gryphiswaldense TaxID=55518 RepID=A4TY82_9PROT|nr:hypothetical protein MGR_3439 [Magnetospirillum gryphiswaldense MSR-1]